MTDVIPHELVGYKGLWIPENASYPLLHSPSHDTVWQPNRWTIATCERTRRSCAPDDIPGDRCTCGIYTSDTRDWLRETWYTNFYDGQIPCICELGLAGRFIEGAVGYRAARARIRKIWIAYSGAPYVARLSAIYNVPVTIDRVHVLGTPDPF